MAVHARVPNTQPSPTSLPSAPRVLTRAFPTPAKLAWSVKPFWYGGKCSTTNLVKASTPSTPSLFPDKGLPGQRQQDLGGCITYARKYCLQGLYGLYADDGLDPDEISYGDAGTSKAAAPARLPTPAPTPAPAPLPVTVEKPEQRALTDEEKKLALSIIKDKDKGAEWKKDFMAKFYPSAEKLTASMISTLEHLHYLEALQLATPF